MINLVTQWGIGFSLIACIILWCVYWWIYEAFDKTLASRLACTAMLGSIGALQLWHGWALATGSSVFSSELYSSLLYFSTIAFFAFYFSLIHSDERWPRKLLCLIILPLIGPWLPSGISIPLAFFIGATGSTWLILRMQSLQQSRHHFALERLLLIVITVVAFLIVAVGLTATWIGERIYLIAYPNLTSLVLAVVIWLLLRYPDVMQKAVDMISSSYAKSTLNNQDCDQLGQTLQTLMLEQRLYQDESLNLAKLANAIKLTSHQTSELVNTQFGMSVSRFIRHYRIEAAKKALLEEPSASILSIGLSVGFNSQSTFYTAFRAATGQTPNLYRKRSKMQTLLHS